MQTLRALPASDNGGALIDRILHLSLKLLELSFGDERPEFSCLIKRITDLFRCCDLGKPLDQVVEETFVRDQALN